MASAAYMGFAHGTNDAQKTMGIIALALFGAQAAGTLDNLPSWLAFLHPSHGAIVTRTSTPGSCVTCALVMAAGTAAGGWRIIKTLGHKMVKLHPIHGFAAEASAATMLTLASALRHAGVDHAQHLHRDHGRGLRQALQRDQVDGDRAHRSGRGS